jgi:hypothetical protein
MAKEALVSVKDLTKEEVVAKMRSGELIPPKKGAERDEFFKFIDMSKEQREAHLSGDKPANPPAPAVPPKEEGKEPPKEPPKEAPKEMWEEMGYESKEKAVEAHRSLVDLNNRLQATLDSLNAKEGKRGSEMKRLTEERDKILKEMDELKKASAPKIEKPVKPVIPNPKNFENGAFDEKYLEAYAKWETDMDIFTDKQATWLAEETTKRVLEKMPKPDNHDHAEPSGDSEWNKFFDTDIPEFQKRMNLVTSVPVRRISDAYITLDPKSAATPQERAVAQAFLKTVSQGDLDTYGKVKQAIDVAYDFESGIPHSRYKTIEGALYDNGMIGEGKMFNVVRPVQLSAEDERAARERARLEKGKSESAIPASQAAAGDKKLSEAQSPDEDKTRYRTLTGMYNTAMNEGSAQQQRFEQSAEYQEWMTLRKKIFGKLPSYIK